MTDHETQEAFKDAFRVHPAGIAVISANSPEGPVGLTASSVASVSIDPLALAFSVTRARGSAGGLLQAESYVVNLLTADNVAIAKTFARSGSERFTPEQGWANLPTGEPYLPAARTSLRCRSLNVAKVGDSSLVLAEVLDVVEGVQGDPVVYFDRSFHRIAEH